MKPDWYQALFPEDGQVRARNDFLEEVRLVSVVILVGFWAYSMWLGKMSIATQRDLSFRQVKTPCGCVTAV